MRISNYDTEKIVMEELGRRIQQYRIDLNITQAELAQRCGLSLKTVARTEKGYDTKISNLIKIMSEIGLRRYNQTTMIPKAN